MLHADDDLGSAVITIGMRRRRGVVRLRKQLRRAVQLRPGMEEHGLRARVQRAVHLRQLLGG